MKSIALFMLFIGSLLIIKNYYENKYVKQTEPKTIIKYLPISQYEQVMTDEQSLSDFYKGMFEQTQPNVYDYKKNNISSSSAEIDNVNP
jgi:hypothetical protein